MVSATASGYSGNRAAIASGEAMTWLKFPRRSGSEASSVECRRIATKASWSGARHRAWACTSPVATQRTPSWPATRLSRRLRARSSRPKRSLQLDAQLLRPEGITQAPEGSLVVDPMPRTAAQTDEPRGVLEHGLERHRRRGGRTGPLTRVRVRTREDPAQAGPAPGVPDQQRQMAAIVEIHLRTVDRPQPQRSSGDRELHRAGDRVVVGERERLVPVPGCRGGDLVGQRCAIEERERGVAVKLHIGHEHMFASRPDGPLPLDRRERV